MAIGGGGMDAELEQFKRINLVDYASTKGYEVDKKKTTKASVVMRDGNGDKIVISKSPQNHSIYFSVRDSQDHGTIIDFIQNREGKNLGEIRKSLRSWSGSDLANKKLPKPKTRKYDPISVNRVFNKFKAVNGWQPYLDSRGLSPAIKSERFHGKIRSNKYGDAIFVHRGRKGITGYEIRGRKYKGFAKNGKKSLWFSRNFRNDNRLVISETAIDGLSYHQIHGDERTRYASTGGNLNNDVQPDLLKSAINRMIERGGKVVLAFDNDQGGRELARKIRDMVPEDGQDKIKEHYPPREGQDWNEALTESNNARQAQEEQRPGEGFAMRPR